MSTFKIVSLGIPAGGVGKDIVDHISARARKRIKHERAQARRHRTNFKGYGDICSQSAGIDAGIISVKGEGNLGCICAG